MHGNSLVINSGRPCSSCHWFDGWHACGYYALCAKPGCCRVRSQPERGCVEYQREPGSDDEPLHPPGFTPPLVAQETTVRPVAWAP